MTAIREIAPELAIDTDFQHPRAMVSAINSLVSAAGRPRQACAGCAVQSCEKGATARLRIRRAVDADGGANSCFPVR